jgi:DNA-binding MarR family transcriptional regulator
LSSSKQFNHEVAELWQALLPFGTAGQRPAEPPVEDGSAVPYALACVSVLQLASMVTKRMDSFVKPFGLTVARMGVLLALYFSQRAISPSELGFLLFVTRGNMTGLVQGLVDDDLVKRTQNPEDRRGQLLRLTVRGQNLVDEYLPHHFAALAQLFEGITAEEAVVLAKSLRKVREGMRTPSPPTRSRQARSGPKS